MEHYKDFETRLETYRDTWSKDIPVTVDELAKAGFYYKGTHDKVDRVQCPWCFGMLYNWQKGDTAFGEHMRYFPSCSFVVSKFMKTESVKEERSSLSLEEAEVDNLIRKNETLKSSITCKVCLEEPLRVVFLPCQHFVCCAQCSSQVDKCPMCREEILGTIKAFM